VYFAVKASLTKENSMTNDGNSKTPFVLGLFASHFTLRL